MTGNRLMLLDTSELADKDLFAPFYEKMSTERKNKIDALKVESAKRLSLGAGILLEKALAEAGIVVAGAASGAEATSVLETASRIAFGPQGKPYIEGCQDFFFNLSHSGSMVAIAVSDREVGVDIQKFKHFNERLTNYIFNTEDREFSDVLLGSGGAAQESGDEAALDRVYTRMWAMKESVMKYFGKGISMEPQKIALRLEGEAGHMYIRVSHPDYDCSRLFISEYPCSGADDTFYGLAVCSEYEAFSFVTEELSI